MTKDWTTADTIKRELEELRLQVEEEYGPGVDPRLPILAQMAGRIFCEKQIYHDNQEARRMAVDQAFLLLGEIETRLRRVAE